MRSLFVFLTVFFLVSCTSTKEVPDPASAADVVPAVDGEEYRELIANYTESDKRYSGFHLAYESDVTILNSRVAAAKNQRKAHFLRWSIDKARTEREETLRAMSTYTTFFISFFAPDDDYDDLNKPDSIWKVYLNFNGTRYEGKVEKIDQKLIELIALYPHHDRWSTPYKVTFNVPMTAVEETRSVVTMTSSLGESVFTFEPILGRGY